jgi:hypothetical protein
MEISGLKPALIKMEFQSQNVTVATQYPMAILRQRYLPLGFSQELR